MFDESDGRGSAASARGLPGWPTVRRVVGHDVPRPGAFDEVCERARAGAVVVVQKPSLTFTQLETIIDASNGRLVVDLDDAIWMGYAPGDPADGLPSLEATLRSARVIMVGSEHLAAWARRVSDSDVLVLAPSLDLRRYRRSRRHEGVSRPVVCWVGTSGNHRDLESFAMRCALWSRMAPSASASSRTDPSTHPTGLEPSGGRGR